MRMGSGGAGSSYMNPGVRTSPDGQQTWEEYIKDEAETFNGHNMERAGSKLAAQYWVENNYATKSYVDSKIPSTPTP